MLDDFEAAAFGLYVHWPFCLAKCPYCDFNSHVRPRIAQARWRAALVRELDTVAERFAAALAGRSLTSIFFGGGTPSLMAPDTAAAVIAAAGRHWAIAPDIEITLEANPTSVESGTFAGFADAGVNRLSLGVQALDDDALAFLGRGHSVGEALRALGRAQAAVRRVSLDLIYARPGQTLPAWRDELARALDLGTGHLSLYQLTIERGTPFFQAARAGRLRPLDDDAAADLFAATQQMTAAAGRPAYEISNHARPGEESRHNLLYWRDRDVLGIGPGAHGRLTVGGERLAHRRRRSPEAWLAAVERDGHAGEAEQAVSPRERFQEALMMGLRLSEGVAVAGLERRLGAPLDTAVDANARARLRRAGLLDEAPDRLVLTPAGRPVLNAVLGRLLLSHDEGGLP